MATTTPNTSRASTLRTRPPGVAPRKPRKRSTGLITVAALLVVGFGLATGLAVTRAGTQVPVVTVSAAVPKGHVIERGDLTSRAVSGVQGAIPTERIEQLVGSTAAVDLLAGQVLLEDMITDAALPSTGESLVGLALDAGRLPAAGLDVGDRVRVLAVPAGEASSDKGTVDLDSPPVLTESASVHSIHGSASGALIEVTLVVAEKDANRVAAYGTAGRIALVEIPSTDGD